MKKDLSEELWFIAVGFVFLAALWLSACAPSRPPERAGVSSSSLVTLMRVRPATPASFLGDGLSRDRYEPYCGAFAVKRAGRVQLATAAHCVGAGQSVRYVPPSGWGLGTAHVVFWSPDSDLAYLEPESSAGLVPLDVAPAPGPGERVRAFSSVYGQTSFGRVTARLGFGWYETDQTIVRGWSGSPVVDASGRAVGVVAQCFTRGGECLPGITHVSALAF